MTVDSTQRKNTYTGTGSTSTFAYNFKVFAAADLFVKRTELNGSVTVLPYPGGYTVTGVGNPGGGTITLTAGNLASGVGLTIERVLPYLQATDLRNAGGYYPESVEEQLDKNVMMMQQLADTTDVPSIRADLQALENDLAALDSRVDGVQAELDASQVDITALDGRIDTLEAAAAYNPRGPWVTATAYAVNDTVSQGGVTYICLFAHTSGTFATDLTNAYWASLAAAVNPTYAFRASSLSPDSLTKIGYRILWPNDSDDDSGLFDSGSCYDTATGWYTAPMDGVYHFDSHIYPGVDNTQLSLVRDRGGVIAVLAYGDTVNFTFSNTGSEISTDVLLQTGDKIGIYCSGAGSPGLYAPYSWFSGHRVN